MCVCSLLELMDSILTLVKEQGIEVPSLERHAAEGNLSAFSADVARLFAGLYAAQTENRTALDDPSAIPPIAQALCDCGIVTVSPSNGVCVMNEPDVAVHADVLCSLAKVRLCR